MKNYKMIPIGFANLSRQINQLEQELATGVHRKYVLAGCEIGHQNFPWTSTGEMHLSRLGFSVIENNQFQKGFVNISEDLCYDEHRRPF